MGDDTRALRAFVSHESWAVRGAAVDAIAALGGANDVETLRTAAGDEFTSVRAAAFEGLLRLEPSTAAELIPEAWPALPVAVRMRLARAAVDYGVDAVVLVAAEDTDRRVRDAAGE